MSLHVDFILKGCQISLLSHRHKGEVNQCLCFQSLCMIFIFILVFESNILPSHFFSSPLQMFPIVSFVDEVSLYTSAHLEEMEYHCTSGRLLFWSLVSWNFGNLLHFRLCVLFKCSHFHVFYSLAAKRSDKLIMKLH